MAHKRSIYLINPKFQIKTTLFICSLVFIVSLPFPVIIYWLVAGIHKMQASGMFGPEFQKVVGDVEAKRSSALVFLILWQLIFIALVFIFQIFQSHKIAGPMYKLRTYFQKVINGDPVDTLFFRKGDHFQEVADDFNKAFKAMKSQHEEDLKYLSEVRSYINNLATVLPEDKKPVLSEIDQKLAVIQSRQES